MKENLVTPNRWKKLTVLQLLPLSQDQTEHHGFLKRNYYDAMANYHGKGKRTMNEDVNFLLKIENADFPLLCWFTRVYSIGICGKQWEISVSPSIFPKGRALQFQGISPHSNLPNLQKHPETMCSFLSNPTSIGVFFRVSSWEPKGTPPYAT